MSTQYFPSSKSGWTALWLSQVGLPCAAPCCCCWENWGGESDRPLACCCVHAMGIVPPPPPAPPPVGNQGVPGRPFLAVPLPTGVLEHRVLEIWSAPASPFFPLRLRDCTICCQWWTLLPRWIYFTVYFSLRVLNPVSAFLFLNVSSQSLYFVFHFNIDFLFFFPLLFLFLVLVPICSSEFSRFEPLLPGKQGQALLASKTNYIFRLNFYFWELLRRWAETSWKSLSSAAPYFLSFWVVSNSEAPLVIPSCNTDPVLPHETLFPLILILFELWSLSFLFSLF